MEVKDSFSIENAQQCLLHIKAISINNLNFSLPSNDVAFKTSLQYVLRMTLSGADVSPYSFVYALPSTTTAIKE